MVQIIGLMVGLYIMARCAEMFDNHDAMGSTRALAVLAFVGNLAAIVMLLLLGGSSVAVPR